MKGPSLDAIRKFKEQQEQRKRQEDERRIQEKLNTLGHRAAHGDRKAKIQLRKIEQVQETKSTQPSQPADSQINHRGQTRSVNHNNNNNNNNPTAKRKSLKVETTFEDLMKLASKNTNEFKVTQPPIERRIKIAPKQRNDIAKVSTKPSIKLDAKSSSNPNPTRPIVPKPSTSNTTLRKPQDHTHRHQAHRIIAGHRPILQRPQVWRAYENDYDDYDEEEDEYESDGFVVNEDDDEVRDELSKTLKSVFRYDKRRCDLREQEIDRQYRAIGKVSTFEDLEKEERRASRLAAAEDAKEQRVEEERKRKKKIRLKGFRD